MNTLARHSADPDYRPLYAANLIAQLAARLARSDKSATSWDQYEGYIDATNTDRSPELTRNAYVFILDEINKNPETKNLFIGLNRMHVPLTAPDKSWLGKIASNLMIGHRKGLDLDQYRPTTIQILDTFACGYPKTGWITGENESLNQLLIQQLEDEVSKLEKDIHASLRKPIREQLTFLSMTSAREHGDHQDILRVPSARGLYRFLSISQCAIAPSLSLSAGGLVYARWRESRDRSIGCMFLTGAIVDYGLRNLPKQHGGTTSPSELWSLITQLGFDDMIRPTAETRAA